MVTNIKLTFTNVPFRRNSACVMIEKWLRFRRVITVRLSIYFINISYLKQILERRLFLNDLFLL